MKKKYIVALGICYYFIVVIIFKMFMGFESGPLEDKNNNESQARDKIVVVFDNVMKVYAIDKLHEHAKKKRQLEKNFKYILIWTSKVRPLDLLQSKQKSFFDNNCKYTNCFVTTKRSYLPNVKDYAAILFSGCGLRNLRERDLPQQRDYKQKFIFASLEPAAQCPVTNPIFDSYFNWTWTYRLSSDIKWRYFKVLDTNGTEVGPSIDIKWPQSYDGIGKFTQMELNSKSKMVAWFPSQCSTMSQREVFVEFLDHELKKYGWSVNIYGKCGKLPCKGDHCYERFKKDYYFYLAFETAFEENFVTHRILKALKYSTVPVVYGGAEYSRFLSPGSYLNARQLGVENLARVMNDIVQNMTSYYEFFKWRSYFRFEKSDETSELCNVCTALNDEELMNRTTQYNFLRLWWNGLT